MYSTILSGAIQGVNACIVHVEVDVAKGLPSFSMVGSLSAQVRESRERVWAALKNAGLEIPPMRITVNLSPADLKKEGTGYDLPIAIGLLEALGYFSPERTQNILFLGELGLNGEIRGVRGVLPIVREAAAKGIEDCFLPLENVKEGAIVPGIRVRGIRDITELLLLFQTERDRWEEMCPSVWVDVASVMEEAKIKEELDFSQVRGQEGAKRAALIAAAGFHNLLMTGPPGAGKSMIAKRIPTILPRLTLEESLEVTTVYSVAGKLGAEPLVTRRPFQNPHHTISPIALTGGGIVPKPGLISLAHRGVLFLDELTEFSKKALESMRQPLEDRSIRIVRMGGNLIYPADFMLVCAMNPCPCGYYPDRNRCSCTEPQIRSYLGKISGPILDRIDLCVELQPVDVKSLGGKTTGESGESIRKKVEVARRIQKERFHGVSYSFNADIPPGDLDLFCELGKAESACMEELYEKMKLSARSFQRIRRVARTIADLSGEEKIREEHLLEAAMYRPDGNYWR